MESSGHALFYYVVFEIKALFYAPTGHIYRFLNCVLGNLSISLSYLYLSTENIHTHQAHTSQNVCVGSGNVCAGFRMQSAPLILNTVWKQSKVNCFI